MNYYNILEIGENASQETIRAAYKVLSKKYHPDVYNDGGIAMKNINEAYSILSNTELRVKYDALLQKERTQEKKNTTDKSNNMEDSSVECSIKENKPITFIDIVIFIGYLIFQVLYFLWGVFLLLAIIGLFTGHTQQVLIYIFDKIISFI